MVPANNFPDHPVNILDYFYIITILLQDIYDADHFPDHLPNVLDYCSHICHLALGYLSSL
jgi:hypothetical protein